MPVHSERKLATVLFSDEHFRALHLDWHAAQTEALIRLRAAFG